MEAARVLAEQVYDPGACPDIHSSSIGYEKRFSSPTGQWFLTVQREIVFQLLRRRYALSILDIGGGHGQLAPYLAEDAYNVTVLGSGFPQDTRIAPLIDNKTLSYQRSSFLKLPFEDRSFDIVLCFRQLPHIEKWNQCFKELCRVAKQSVIFDVSTTKSLNSFSPFLFNVKQKIEKNTRLYKIFKEDEFNPIIQESDFFIAERRPEFFFPMGMHRAFNSLPISRPLETLVSKSGLTKNFGSPTIFALDREELREEF